MEIENTFTYRFLDNLPQVPERFLTDFDQYKNNDMAWDVTGWTTVWKGQEVGIADYNRHHAAGEFYEWLKTNIVEDPIDFGITFHNHLNKNPQHHYPHIDATRSYTLMYLVDQGGDNVITRWYKEKDGPLVRPERSLHSQISNIYDKLEEIDSVYIPLRRWCLLHSKIIHGAFNLTRARKSIQISLGPENKFV